MTGAYVLKVASFDGPTVAHAVLVLQLAVDDVAEDFRVAMRMLAKTFARFYHVIVDNAQGTETHVVRIEKIAERECMPAVQPAQLALAAFVRSAFRDRRFACRWLF